MNSQLNQRQNVKVSKNQLSVLVKMIVVPAFLLVSGILLKELKLRDNTAVSLTIASQLNGQVEKFYKVSKNISEKDNIQEIKGAKAVVINTQNSPAVNNTSSKSVFLKHDDTSVKSVAISADGQYIVTGDNQGKVWLWDANGNRIAKPFAAHKQGVVVLGINVNSQTNDITVISGDNAGEVKIWKLKINTNTGN